MDSTRLAAFLARHPPFDSLGPDALAAVASAAAVERYRPGELILDAFTDPSTQVYVVLDGEVDLWNSAEPMGEAADERVEPGGLFGFSAMLTERSIGPRAVAAVETSVASLPGAAAWPAFASREGATFLAGQLTTAESRLSAPVGTYSTVDELIRCRPLVVGPTTSAGDVARRMTQEGIPYAAVRLGGGTYGLITDALLRQHLIVDGLPASTPAAAVMRPDADTVVLGDSAVGAFIRMLERGAEFLLVTDRVGELQGVIAPIDFAVSPSSAGVAIHEQLSRAGSVEEVQRLARTIPRMLAELLSRGLASGKVIAVYSALIDTIVRRAIVLTFANHPDLSLDDFTWLSLGSNGRREAVLSSDVDSAVAFVDGVDPNRLSAYRAAFVQVNVVLAGAGLSWDAHGATASREEFSRTNAQWRAAGEEWLLAPTDNNGAMMTSLLVDGRPIHGDPGLPEVSKVFGDLRNHPGTMRLLLEESLAYRARLRSMRGLLTRREDTFNLKTHALVPIVNIGRWAALSVGSAVLPTTERLRSASGSGMLPQEQASSLIDIFEVLQRLRLRYQLLQLEAGEPANDVFVMDKLSALDRSVVTSAVREIAAIQRRMANIAVYTGPEEWAAPTSTG